MVRYQAPRGTRDFLPAEMAVRNHVETVVRSTFESYGFQQVQTPTFEQYDLLAARSGEEIKESMFTFASDAGRYALRPELTSPVCRLVASGALSDLPRPYKLYYFGPCFRYCRPQAGRYREFYQAGVELMGTHDPLADAEVVAVAAGALRRLGIHDYRLRIGDVGVIRQLLEEYLGTGEHQQEWQSRVVNDIDKVMVVRDKCLGLVEQQELSADDQAYLSGLATALHKLQEEVNYAGEFEILPDPRPTAANLPAIAEATYRAAWVAQGILTPEKADFLLGVSRVRGPAPAALEAARALLAGRSALAPLEDLARVCEWLPTLGVAEFELILGMARNLDFYTGTVFEIDSPLLGAQRQVCGGGRYDKLVGEFGGPQLPATGFAFGFDRLVETYKKTHLEPSIPPVDVVVVAPLARRRQAVELAERLRSGSPGWRVSVDLAEREVKGQIDYADKLGAPLVVLIGVGDLGADQCKLRQGTGAAEHTLPISSLRDELPRLLKKGPLA